MRCEPLDAPSDCLHCNKYTEPLIMRTLAGLKEMLAKARRQDETDVERKPNVLVISDLHLGEDLKPNSVGALRHIARVERELESFLAHYTRSRLDGRPWRL